MKLGNPPVSGLVAYRVIGDGGAIWISRWSFVVRDGGLVVRGRAAPWPRNIRSG